MEVSRDCSGSKFTRLQEIGQCVSCWHSLYMTIYRLLQCYKGHRVAHAHSAVQAEVMPLDCRH